MRKLRCLNAAIHLRLELKECLQPKHSLLFGKLPYTWVLWSIFLVIFLNRNHATYHTIKMAKFIELGLPSIDFPISAWSYVAYCR